MHKVKPLAELNLCDDFLFGKVMQDMEICRVFLERILGISILKVEQPQIQKTLGLSPEDKNIRVDVYVNDEAGTVYDVEMQTANSPDLPRRSRYYHSVIDVNNLANGQLYRELPDTFVIFICTFDPFKQRRHIYTFNNVCVQDTNLSLGDGRTTIFVNTRGELDDVDDKFKNLMRFIEESTSENIADDDGCLASIYDRIEAIKRKDGMEVEYMTFTLKMRDEYDKGMNDGIEQGISQGIAQGIAQGILGSIRNLMDSLKLSAEEAMDALHIDATERPKYQKMLG